MRVLLTTQPAYGHFRPLLPLADALRASGHEIRVASAARFAPVIEDHGFQPEVAGLDWLEGDHAGIPEELRAPPDLPLAQFFAHQFVWMTAERLARDVDCSRMPCLEIAESEIGASSEQARGTYAPSQVAGSDKSHGRRLVASRSE